MTLPAETGLPSSAISHGMLVRTGGGTRVTDDLYEVAEHLDRFGADPSRLSRTEAL